ncbi:probable carnitine O-acetyltransferase, mitochondrial precursor [Serendipita indica DSM 11827]|uniref:Probable carnitine O-acetyltransferase, mitochondrial n=1 Tax=Serendipita indica (strain DSM 11827) TaxID=1109443 RepID=G4TSP3_SERID|nr:probable carnitine O-acetyltransferase, mitochondrial precursor [Serendipita indica DSM 11827]
MLAHEAELPGLPVPSIQSTAEKYLETTRPHLTPSEFRTTQLAVNDFISSPLVRRLQTRLEERAASEKSAGRNNWLSEWWNDVAYMAYRDPVVVFVSYFYVHMAGQSGKGRDARAAELLKGLLMFRQLVESQKLEPEKVKDYYLAMSSYKWLFNATRLPTAGSDTAKKYPADSHNHVVFIRKNRFYEVPVAIDGKELSVADLEALIAKVVAAADKAGAGPAVGALTSDNRDIWTEARKHLASVGHNSKTLERIDSAIVVIPLDDTSPTSREELSWACWTGANGGSGPGNRWFDKHQLIVFDNARSGFLGEHSCMVLQYEGLGKNTLKTYKISPDATAQLIKQLALHKLHGRPGVCYESAQTRKFALGRTEVIRAASQESKEWAEAMLKGEKTDADKMVLFKKAVNRHLQYAAWAADGQGVDRHLFGLKRLLKEGEETPRLYEDIAFSRTNHWELSTSNLSSKWLDGWGYGEVVPDGYGLSYSIGDGYIRWTMTCLKEMGKKDKGAKDLKQALTEAADMVKALLESTASEPKAKL